MDQRPCPSRSRVIPIEDFAAWSGPDLAAILDRRNSIESESVMDLTSLAAAIAIQIGAAVGLVGMLTVFARASRPGPSRTRPVAEVRQAAEPLGAGDVLIKQRGVETPVS
jgi:hypothetical protein